MAEDVRFYRQLNPEFMRRHRNDVTNEGYVKWQNVSAPSEYNKFDWMVRPKKNVTQYLTTPAQNFDIDMCVYSHFFSNVIYNTNYLLINKYQNFFGYESIASCFYPSIYSQLFTKISKVKDDSSCYSDTPNEFFYSVVCRGWYL
jgi:hypothetical protein